MYMARYKTSSNIDEILTTKGEEVRIDVNGVI